MNSLLVDRVLPDQRLRQWVMSPPFELRLAMARRPALLSAVGSILACEIGRTLNNLAKQQGVPDGLTAMVVATQLCGGSLNLHPHFHVLALDGVYSSPDGTQLVFTPTRAPSATEVGQVAERVHARVLRWLKRRGLLQQQRDTESDQDRNGTEPEPDPIDACAQMSLRLGQLGHVDESGESGESGVVYDSDADLLGSAKRKAGPWSGEHEGWNLHAGVTVAQGDAAGRERLCRYVLRPALSLDRLSWTRDGRVAYRVKYPKSPSRTHLLMQPVQLLAKLASIMPPPRRPLVRYFGLLSSASAWRSRVVPPALPPQAGHAAHAVQATPQAASEPASEAHPSAPPAASALAAAAPDARLPTTPAQTPTIAMLAPTNSDPKGPNPNAAPSALSWRGAVQAATRYIPWADLLRRVFDLDCLACPRCGGRLRIIAFVHQKTAVRDILASLGLPHDPPVPARARSPTLFDHQPPVADGL